MLKTKIVCTIGPKTSTPEAIQRLIDDGMAIARLNASHNSLNWHQDTIKTIRRVDSSIPILVDLPGRKIRTAKFDYEFTFNKGDQLTLTSDQDYRGTDKVVVNYPDLHRDLKLDDVILADDGTLKFRVISIENEDIVVLSLTKGVLKSSKGINVPYVKLNTPLISSRDREIIRLCEQIGVDFIGLSFVESADHVDEVKSQLVDGGKVKVISKIENQFGVDNMNEIIEKSFGILIDRGDLGAETRIEHIPILQKRIIEEARGLNKPVIVATEMLHSMIENAAPTKAEVADITNAVFDGCAGLMLSGETAVGEFPFDACKIMKDTALVTEEALPTRERSLAPKANSKTPEIIAQAIWMASKELPVTKIVCFTNSGYSARVISSQRPRQSVIAVTDQIEKAREFNLYYGVEGVVLRDIQFRPTEAEYVIQGLRSLFVSGNISMDDTIIVTAVRFPNPPRNTYMNYFEVHNVEDLAEVFNW